MKEASESLGLKVKIDHLSNPRVEKEEHYYNPSNESLLKLGLKPILLSQELVDSIVLKVKESSHLIDKEIVLPTVKWKQ